MITQELLFVVMSTFKSESRSCLVFPRLIVLGKASVQDIKDVFVLETLLVPCVIRVGPIGTEMIVVCSLGHASSATEKAGVVQILKLVSVKNNLQVQLALCAHQIFTALIVPDSAILCRRVMVMDCVTPMDTAS